MAALVKLIVTRWVDPRTKARVPAGTMGAKKIKDKTDHYYIVDKSDGRVKRTNTHCSDYRAAQAVLTEYHRLQERGIAGLTDPFKPHLDRPILDHLAEYVVVVRERVRTTAYPATVERELKRMFTACNIEYLRDLTAEKVQGYLVNWEVKAATKNRTRSYLYSFYQWLVRRDRVATNIVDRVDTAKPKQGEQEKRRRRAMKLKELRRLISAVNRFPLAAVETNHGGRPRRDGSRTGPVSADIQDPTRAALQMKGRERALLYRTAILTGLRRGELSRVKVRHLQVKQKVLDLPGQLTKNARPAVIPLVPSLSRDLKSWIADTCKAPDDPLFEVPEARNMARQHKARVDFAGIPYNTDHGFADFHSLRKTINTQLRIRGVPLRLRQRFLRHAAADLATTSYDDERTTELRPIVELLSKLDAYLTSHS